MCESVHRYNPFLRRARQSHFHRLVLLKIDQRNKERAALVGLSELLVWVRLRIA
jgi:hypothetical protein